MSDEELFSWWLKSRTKNLLLGPAKMALFIALHRNIWNKSPKQRSAVREMYEGRQFENATTRISRRRNR